MYDVSNNYLDMELNTDNDMYYIEKINDLINESNKIAVLKKQNEDFLEPKTESKGCWEWFWGLFGLYKKEEEIEHPPFVGLINIGNNCYLNAGLQILSRCYPLLIELLKKNYEKNELTKLFVESMVTLLFRKDKFYNPTKFIECFCKINKDFIIGRQQCSQDFIRTILRNINDILDKDIRFEEYFPSNGKEYNAYKSYIFENKIFPESKAYSIFSGMLKIEISGKCNECNESIKNYSFTNFVDLTMYLDGFSTKCKFSDVLRKNIGCQNNVIMKCPKCKVKINLKSISNFVKIPEIFIFTLERYLIRNQVPIEPDDNLNLSDYIDDSYFGKDKCLYELFAINIRIGKDLSFGHEICQIKQKNKWYTINDGDSYPRQREFNEYSYGLFYRRIHPKK